MRSESVFNTVYALYTNATKLGQTPRTIAIEGAPGGGKTTVVHEVGKKLGVPVIEKHMPTMLVEDFGIPFPKDEGHTEFSYMMPDWFPYQGKPGTENGGILLFDDRNQANADLQKVLANICQARNLHGVPLAKGWMVVSTGNRQQDKAGANRVLSHLRNRESVIEFETNVDDWQGWAIDHGVREELTSFIRFRPGLLHKFDPQNDRNPTPRSWVEGVADVLDTVPHEVEYELFSGAVGEGPAAEFVGFMKTWRNLPDPEEVLKNPTTTKVPTDPIVLYALIGALAGHASKANADAFIEFGMRLPAEFSVLMVSTACRRDSTIAATKAFARWNQKFQKMLW